MHNWDPNRKYRYFMDGDAKEILKIYAYSKKGEHG